MKKDIDDQDKLTEDIDEETILLLRYDKARRVGEEIFTSDYEVEKRAKEKGISLFLARKELIRERQRELKQISTVAKKIVLSRLSKQAKRKLGIKEGGRPKGSKNKKSVISKKVFYEKLRRLARSKSEHDEALTQKEAAEVLGLGGTRQLRYRLKEYGEGKSWKEFIDSLLN